MDPERVPPLANVNVVYILHPPFTGLPASNVGGALEDVELTYGTLVANPNWFLDPSDFIRTATENDVGVDVSPAIADSTSTSPVGGPISYPLSLVPPLPLRRGLSYQQGRATSKVIGMSSPTTNGNQQILRCTFCRRSFSNSQARSAWKQHILKHHRIDTPISNHRNFERSFEPTPSPHGPSITCFPIIFAEYSSVELDAPYPSQRKRRQKTKQPMAPELQLQPTSSMDIVTCPPLAAFMHEFSLTRAESFPAQTGTEEVISEAETIVERPETPVVPEVPLADIRDAGRSLPAAPVQVPIPMRIDPLPVAPAEMKKGPLKSTTGSERIGSSSTSSSASNDDSPLVLDIRSTRLHSQPRNVAVEAIPSKITVPLTHKESTTACLSPEPFSMTSGPGAVVADSDAGAPLVNPIPYLEPSPCLSHSQASLQLRQSTPEQTRDVGTLMHEIMHLKEQNQTLADQNSTLQESVKHLTEKWDMVPEVLKQKIATRPTSVDRGPLVHERHEGVGDAEIVYTIESDRGCDHRTPLPVDSGHGGPSEPPSVSFASTSSVLHLLHLSSSQS